MTRGEATERYARFEEGEATVTLLERVFGEAYGMFDAEGHLYDLGFSLKNGYPSPEEVEQRIKDTGMKNRLSREKKA